jgi:hypothetical protein
MRQPLTFCLGASVDQPATSGTTPLINATARAYSNCVSLLLEAGANPNRADLVSNTPLYVACVRGHIQCLRLLLRYGAKTDVLQSESGTYPIHWATKKGFTQCVRALVLYGANVDVRQTKSVRSTALAIAFARRFDDIARLLLDNGASCRCKIVFDANDFSHCCSFLVEVAEESTIAPEWVESYRTVVANRLTRVHSNIVCLHGLLRCRRPFVSVTIPRDIACLLSRYIWITRRDARLWDPQVVGEEKPSETDSEFEMER